MAADGENPMAIDTSYRLQGAARARRQVELLAALSDDDQQLCRGPGVRRDSRLRYRALDCARYRVCL
jgi:hypothetical protein